MTRTTSRKTKRRVTPVTLKIKPSFFEGVLKEVMVRVYGEDSGGYSFDPTALQSLKETSDTFIQNMWTQVKQITVETNKREIDKESVMEWKRRTGFRLRRKLSGLSLCHLFELSTKQSPKRYIYSSLK